MNGDSSKISSSLPGGIPCNLRVISLALSGRAHSHVITNEVNVSRCWFPICSKSSDIFSLVQIPSVEVIPMELNRQFVVWDENFVSGLASRSVTNVPCGNINYHQRSVFL